MQDISQYVLNESNIVVHKTDISAWKAGDWNVFHS